jgi:hypothetical protein
VAMRFGAWLPIDSAVAEAPEGAGVLQTRADSVLAYPSGRSAMVYYAHCPSGGSLRGFVSGLGAGDLQRASDAGARWIRFAETSDPETDFERLLDHFVERFGAPPVANAGSAGAPS